MINYQDRSLEVRKYRESFKPKKIKLLLIGESPPHSGNDKNLHFFYNPNYNTNDNLYKAISSIIFNDYPHLDKGMGLMKFMELGFFLIDATDKAINKIKDQKTKDYIIISELPARLNELESLISKTTPIVLIKKNIYQLLHLPLEEKGFKVLNNTFLPFPLYENNIIRFKRDFIKYASNVLEFTEYSESPIKDK